MNFSTKPRSRKTREDGEKSRREILMFVRLFWMRQHYGPSVEEIMEGAGISSKSVVNYHVNRLIEAGKLEGPPGVARSIHPAGMEIKLP